MSVTSQRRSGTINLYKDDGETDAQVFRASLRSVEMPSGDELSIQSMKQYKYL